MDRDVCTEKTTEQNYSLDNQDKTTARTQRTLKDLPAAML